MFELDFERWLKLFFFFLFIDVLYLAMYYLRCLNSVPTLKS